MQFIYYSLKQFKDRVVSNNTVDIAHIGPRMFYCVDDAGSWWAYIMKTHLDEKQPQGDVVIKCEVEVGRPQVIMM